ncbi:hypothetical protein KQX54_009257 [Cotesia glomerata]|uniref:C2H2-type domain-containing protein n=1 Tax=Cotesia glomerata TaxID=32391 RepID=A0AAV7J8J8_COTGL|nr:hypothetical protein KQX54_009257 [Cotesia glomerata]
MLTEQTTDTMSVSIDSVPLGSYGFLIFDDGRTVLVTEHNDESSEWLSAPVTLIQSNDAQSKSSSNLSANSSIVQLSLGNLIHANNSQQTLIQNQTNVPIHVDLNEGTDAEFIPKQPDKAKVIESTGSFFNNNGFSENSKRFIPILNKSVSRPRVGRPRKDAVSTESPKISIKCEICGEEFTKQTLYRKHMDHHAEEKPHRCPKCPASFNIPTNFTLHMATHNLGEPKCPECGRKFARMASLKSHLALHEKEEHLFCKECEDVFPTKVTEFEKLTDREEENEQITNKAKSLEKEEEEQEEAQLATKEKDLRWSWVLGRSTQHPNPPHALRQRISGHRRRDGPKPVFAFDPI